MKCAIYIRVSTTEQFEEGFSIASQKERLKAFCSSQGWEVKEVYVEEGVSAKDLKRPAMKRMLNDIKRNKFDIVLVYRLDRLTRSVLDLHELLKTFDKYNVSFKSATEVYDTSSAMGRLFITLVAALAQWERENLSERVKLNMLQMIDEGKRPGGKNLYGYRFTGTLEAEIVEEEAAIVRKVYNWYIEGYGYRTIASRLDAAGIKPRQSSKWDYTSIREMLMNEMYIGIYKWGDKTITGSHTPIIDEQTFRKVQKLMSLKTPSSSRRGKYPLTGILRCGHCDENPMQGKWDKRDSKVYYRCMNCKRQTHDAKFLPLILDELELLTSSETYFLSKVQQAEGADANLHQAKKDLEKVKKQKDKLMDIYMDPGSPISKEVLFEKMETLNKQEKELQEQLLESEIAEESPEEKFQRLKSIKNISEQYNKATTQFQKDLLSSIFHKIVLTREKGKGKPAYIEYELR
jgi:site-specific DNA recombinase